MEFLADRGGSVRLFGAGSVAHLGAGAQGQLERVWRWRQGIPWHRLRSVVERGDDDDRRLRRLGPRSPAGRLVAISWMFVSLFLVSWFTASMASILTAERLDTGSGAFVVRGPDDLRRLHVAVVAGTSSEDYLRRHQIDYIGVPLKDLLQLLLTGRVQVALGDAPVLRYIARNEPYAGKITVLPQTLQTEPYGIALRDGSAWRKPVDRALLHRTAAPAWRDLIYHYLGSPD